MNLTFAPLASPSDSLTIVPGACFKFNDFKLGLVTSEDLGTVAFKTTPPPSGLKAKLIATSGFSYCSLTRRKFSLRLVSNYVVIEIFSILNSLVII